MPPVTAIPQLKEYNIFEKLGSGTYGDVYKACRKSGPREVFAVKCVQKARMSKTEADAIIGEISILKKLKHDFIVEMKDFNWDSNFIYIVMEYCGGGDLSKYIKSHKKLPEKICRNFLQQLGSALRFLRSKDIAHMDLKPQNILISLNNPRINGPVLKLGDFGFAQHFTSDETKSAIRGSPLYMAPEMVLKRHYDAKVDLWSVGVILYECLFGRAPYKSDTLEELLIKVKSDHPIVIPKGVGISKSCRDLMSRCLERDPVKRIDYEDFFAHEFLDLEHLPSEESHAKAVQLIDGAVSLDNAGKLQEALVVYKSALEYLIPMIVRERNVTTKSALQKKADQYMNRAEVIKCELGLNSTSEGSTTSSSSKSENLYLRSNSKTDELLKLSRNTPPLYSALEIVQSAELYDQEGQTDVAFEKYQTSLGLLLPLLSNEPKGDRKSLLSQEIKRWMTRAETLKDVKALEDKASLAEGEGVDKTCRIQ